MTCKVPGSEPTHSASSYEKAQAQLQKYPPGQPAIVYYNPNNPAEATLEPGTTRGAWATLFMGMAFTAVGMLTLVLAISFILR